MNHCQSCGRELSARERQQKELVKVCDRCRKIEQHRRESRTEDTRRK